MSTRDKIPIAFYIYLLYNCVIIGSKGSEMRLHKNGQCDLYVVFSPKSVGNFMVYTAICSQQNRLALL